MLLVVLSCLLVGTSVCGNPNRNGYVDFNNGSYHCVSFSNHDKNIGCSTGFSGNSGQIFLALNHDNVESFAKSPPVKKRMVVLSVSTFSLANLKALDLTGKVSGVLVIDYHLAPGNKQHHFSSESTCPLSKYDLYSDKAKYKDCASVKWNEEGSGILEESFGFSIILVKDPTLANSIIECGNKETASQSGIDAFKYPLCGVYVYSLMYSFRQTTPSCLAKSKVRFIEQNTFCHPLSGHNVYGTLLQPSPSDATSRPYIVLSARMDTRSLFLDSNVGADSEVLGLVAFMDVVSILADVMQGVDTTALTKNVLFVLFDGESWDYIGSSRFAYDYSRNALGIPDLVNLTIDSWIEFGQLGFQVDGSLWLHSDPIYRSVPNREKKVENLSTSLIAKGKALKVNISSVWATEKDQPLPPSSLHQILRHKIDVAGVLITDHKTSYSNKNYHGFDDDAAYLDVQFDGNDGHAQAIKRVADLSMAVSNTILNLMGADDNVVNKVKLNFSRTLDLAYCFLKDSNCSVFHRILDTESMRSVSASSTVSRHVSVSEEILQMPNLMLRFIGYNLGKKFDASSAECNNRNNWSKRLLSFMTETECVVNSTVYAGVARSPYFDDQERPLLNYSSWTESTWNDIKASVYYIESKRVTSTTYALGISTTLVSLFVSVLIRLKPSLAFPTY